MINEKCHIYERYENTPSDIAESIFFFPQWSGRFVCKSDFRIERANFRSILVLHTKKGSGVLNYRGESVKLFKDSLAFINCLDEHVYYPDGEWEFEFLHFDGLCAVDFYEHIYSLCRRFVFEDDGKLSRMLDDILLLCREKLSVREAQVSSRISDILYHLLSTVQKNRPHLFDEVCEYIEQNLASDISCESVAQHFGFSRSYFSTEFRKNVGATVYEYLLSCRLNKAKALMATEEYCISQIAEKTGFSDSTSFIRAFRRKEGITPLKYKRTVQL